MQRRDSCAGGRVVWLAPPEVLVHRARLCEHSQAWRQALCVARDYADPSLALPLAWQARQGSMLMHVLILALRRLVQGLRVHNHSSDVLIVRPP